MYKTAERSDNNSRQDAPRPVMIFNRLACQFALGNQAAIIRNDSRNEMEFKTISQERSVRRQRERFRLRFLVLSVTEMVSPSLAAYSPREVNPLSSAATCMFTSRRSTVTAVCTSTGT